MTRTNSFVEGDELAILSGLGNGAIVIASQYLHGELKDRWLAHKDEPLDLHYLEEGEELRAYRLPMRRGDACDIGPHEPPDHSRETT